MDRIQCILEDMPEWLINELLRYKSNQNKAKTLLIESNMRMKAEVKEVILASEAQHMDEIRLYKKKMSEKSKQLKEVYKSSKMRIDAKIKEVANINVPDVVKKCSDKCEQLVKEYVIQSDSMVKEVKEHLDKDLASQKKTAEARRVRFQRELDKLYTREKGILTRSIKHVEEELESVSMLPDTGMIADIVKQDITNRHAKLFCCTLKKIRDCMESCSSIKPGVLSDTVIEGMVKEEMRLVKAMHNGEVVWLDILPKY